MDEESGGQSAASAPVVADLLAFTDLVTDREVAPEQVSAAAAAAAGRYMAKLEEAWDQILVKEREVGPFPCRSSRCPRSLAPASARARAHRPRRSPPPRAPAAAVSACARLEEVWMTWQRGTRRVSGGR